MGLWKWAVNKVRTSNPSYHSQEKPSPPPKPVTEANIKEALKDVDDLLIQKVKVKGEQATLFFIKSLVKNTVLQQMVLSPLHKINQEQIKESLSASEVKNDLNKATSSILEGSTLILYKSLILAVDTYSVPERSISTSETESTVIGPQDAFVESINANISLIRRRIKNSKLKAKILEAGVDTKNNIAVIYIEGTANQENVDRVLYRIKNVEFQGFIDLSILQQMIEDKPYSPFPQFGLTSRPDNTCEALLDGRIAVLLDNSSEAVICPTSFFELFTTPEDFYNRWSTATLLRMLRFFGFFVTIMLTPAYVSALTYQPEILPPDLLTLLSESRSKVPFPPVVEALIIELVIEILREAGSRMPTKIGQTIGIVGGIVIGTAAVDAGLASNILIVLVATSALLSFLPPNYIMSNSARFVRYIFIISAGIFGLYGQFLSLAWLMIHLLNLTSLGTPYLTPVIQRTWTDILNSPIRAPIQFFFKRSGMSRTKKPLTRPLDEE